MHQNEIHLRYMAKTLSGVNRLLVRCLRLYLHFGRIGFSVLMHYKVFLSV